MELVREAHRVLDEPVSKPANARAQRRLPPPSFLAYEPSYPLYPYQRQSARILNGIYAGNTANVLCASPTGSEILPHQILRQLAVKHKCRLQVAVPLVALAEQYADLCNLFPDTPMVDAMLEEFGGRSFDSFDSFDDYYDEYCGGFCEAEPVPVVGLWTGPAQVNEVDALICVCTCEIVTIQLDKNPH